MDDGVFAEEKSAAEELPRSSSFESDGVACSTSEDDEPSHAPKPIPLSQLVIDSNPTPARLGEPCSKNGTVCRIGRLLLMF
jgi:hypothetical protein